MRLVLCDDNRILCEALGVALEARGHQIVTTSFTTMHAIAAVAAHQPDACVLDLRFPDPPDGFGAARLIRRDYPATAVLVLSARTDQAALAEARRIGVAGFLRKDQNVDFIAQALDVIASGGVVMGPGQVRLAGPAPGGPPAWRPTSLRARPKCCAGWWPARVPARCRAR